MHVIRFRTYRETRWKNGGGVTHEIARSGESPETDWRVSLATIDRDGPFSDFAGFDRTIVPVEGAGFELSFDDGTRVVLGRLYEPFRFAGEKKVECRLLAGRSRDLNAMTRRSHWTHDVTTLPLAREPLAVDAPRLSFLFFAGDAIVSHGTATIELSGGDTLGCEEEVRLGLTSSAPRSCALLIRITRQE